MTHKQEIPSHLFKMGQIMFVFFIAEILSRVLIFVLRRFPLNRAMADTLEISTHSLMFGIYLAFLIYFLMLAAKEKELVSTHEKPAGLIRRHKNKPPGVAMFILYIATKREDRETILGDFEEVYNDAKKRFSPRMAAVIYWIETGKTIIPLITARFNFVKWLGVYIKGKLS